MGPYQRLFEIDVCHAYFSDNRCQQLEWQPAHATRKTMANLGMLFRPYCGGMAVYYTPQRRQAMALFAAQSEPDAPGFYFKAYARDPFFMNYSRLPECHSEEQLCVDSAHAVAERSEGLRLHTQEFVSNQDRALLSDLWNNDILVRQDKGTPPLCVVHIRPVGKSNSPMDAKGNLHPQSYRIYFDHRCTYWKYFILGPLANKPVSVWDMDNKWKFDRVAPKVGTFSGPAMTFISNAPIPLRQIPTNTFQLRIRATDVEKVMIKKLPSAPINILHHEKRGADVISISEIFINS